MSAKPHAHVLRAAGRYLHVWKSHSIPSFSQKTRRLTFAARRAIIATDGGSLHGGLLPNQGHKTADRGHLYGGFALFPIVFARFVCGQKESGNRKQDHQNLIIVHTPHSLPLLL